MKKIFLASTVFAASLVVMGCNNAATPANKAAPAPTNAAAPAAPAGNTAGGNTAGGGGGGSAAAQAEAGFTFVNQSGVTVITLQMSPTGESSWGPDILGRDVLANGESAPIVFDRDENRCYWDIRSTAEGNVELDMRNVNLCETSSVTQLPAE